MLVPSASASLGLGMDICAGPGCSLGCTADTRTGRSAQCATRVADAMRKRKKKEFGDARALWTFVTFVPHFFLLAMTIVSSGAPIGIPEMPRKKVIASCERVGTSSSGPTP
ncbi:hypothetical protein Ahy_B03g063492 isoform C [Arachis hypogaea]|uniref:Uncharacterized protein n=1 Tax=Arachis hypogaea TaxID=3818 RepID=A0A444ZXC8_ARAHY|nr:hypothetical protein Ahy_B03g063492 isoform C [Arachis hypogaea]